MNVAFRPIDQWPDPEVNPNDPARSVSRERSPFRSSWSRTLELVNYELYRLDADAVAISLALGDEDIWRDGWPRKNSKPAHPGVILEFDTPDGWQIHYCDYWDRWESNVHDIALLLQDLRAVGRRHSARGQQYQGFRKEIGDGNSAGSSRANAASDLLESYGGLREALKATHPDRGGDPGEFRRVQEAREVLGL